MTSAELEQSASLVGLAEALAAAAKRCAAGPGPTADVVDLIALLARLDPPALARVYRDRRDALLDALAHLASHAPFFVSILRRHPDWILRLADEDLSQSRSSESYAELLERQLAQDVSDSASDALRRFKYYELARLTLRELDVNLITDERERDILLEISSLADVLLQRSLRLADATLRRRLGLPPPPEHTISGFAVLGLGKLGARELNYSSDVDLIYVFDGEASPAALGLDSSGSPVASEYFTRLAQELSRVVTTQTSEGFLYRIDLELRPEGNRGALVVAGTAFVNYYDTWAATWERAAAMKARAVAGDLAFGWRTIRALAPMIYRSSVDYESVAAITQLKTRFADKQAEQPTFSIKHGAGGIRDVETIAQALQLLHGGRIPQVRERATEPALQALADVGILPPDDAVALLNAYRFLRRVEHRVQMIGERQVHTLPSEPEALDALAHSLGLVDAAALDMRLMQHCGAVQQLLHQLFPADTAQRILGFLARRVPQLLANPIAREAIGALSEHFAREIEGGPNPQRALNNLEHFIDGIGGRRFYYELLLDRSELVPRLATLFATSEHLSGYLARYPRLIEPIFADPNVLLLSRAQLEDNFAALHRELTDDPDGDGDTESELDSLRLFHHRELVNVGLLDLIERVSREQAESALTEIAEVCTCRALELAARQIAHRSPPEAGARFVVIGMGKLASRELTYGSDLDVIFLYDLPQASEYELGTAQDYFVRLAQKLIWALCTRTGAGLCYEVDARLRPSGNQGPLVTSVSGFQRYHAESAQVWERQALLRARAIAGDTELGADFERLRRTLLTAPLPADVPGEIHRVRCRMEGELARETRGHYDFKTGHGGLLDVESVVQLLQLRHGSTQGDLLEVRPIAAQIDRLENYGHLPPTEAATLRRGWDFLQRLSSRLRIVENRSISDLDEERGDLDSVAKALGYSSPQRSGGARRALLNEYHQQTDAIREVYLRYFGACTE